MSQYIRVCPKCGEKNAISEQLCKCGTSLLTIPPVVEDEESNEEKKFIICDVCGEKNYFTKKKPSICKFCGNDEMFRLVAEVDSKDLESSNDVKEKIIDYPPEAYLRGRNCDVIIELKLMKNILGKQGTLECGFFMKYPKVSRMHCNISFNGKSWVVKDLKSTNYTYMNGQKLKEDESYVLRNGDILSLADLHFSFEEK